MELERGTGMKKWKIMLPAAVAAGSNAAWIGYSYGFRRGIEPITKLQPYFYMDNLVGWDGNRSGSYW